MELSDELIEAVWQKARATGDRPAAQWRKDECGAWMQRNHYAQTSSPFGWKILNVSPAGADTIDNLRAFHHGNGYSIANRKAQCHVTADREGVASTQSVDLPRNKAS